MASIRVKLIIQVSCLALAAACGVAPAGAQRVVQEFNGVAVTNYCAKTLVLNGTRSVPLLPESTQAITDTVGNAAIGADFVYVPTSTLPANPGAVCSFGDCGPLAIRLTCRYAGEPEKSVDWIDPRARRHAGK